ncbi:cytochrome P450 4A6-like, partial [Mizuhopecten yessoensis]|uniref:cytochrome P450 4A6-like n=1 Tax=Mizuhopecten yessoensis TaxID=6573 RepID=UPI000B45A4C5
MKIGLLSSAALTPGNIVGTLVLGVASYILYEVVRFLLHVRYASNTYRDLPGPEGSHWLYGHLQQLPKTSHERLEYGLKITRQFPRYFRFWMGPRANILLNHPETIKMILKTAEPKPIGFGGFYRHALPWLGPGLLIAGGKQWARSRRLLTPAFHFDVLRPYMDIYNEAAEELLNNIGVCAGKGESFETFGVVSACSLDIILRCAFSYRTNCQNLRERHPYVTAVKELTETWVERC